MTYLARIQMFMEKLKQLINCNDNPLINKRIIVCERPQFQSLYEQLDSMIQTLFIDQHHDPTELDDLKKRFLYAAEVAEFIVDLFLSCVHEELHELERVNDLKINRFRYAENHIVNEHVATSDTSSINLDDVRRSMECIKVEYMSMRIDNMMKDSSETTLNQFASASSASAAPRKSRVGTRLDEIIVGINDADAELIRDKLVEDQKKLDVVSIVGMGGLGKTTLATKVFNDSYVKYHFHIRAWVTVSQTYDKRDVLIQVLQSIGVKEHLENASPFQKKDLENASDSRLRELIHKHLMGNRYLIVIDDIWQIETWDQVKLFFPHENTGSRIMLTTRLTEVAKHVNSDGLIHHLGYLNQEKSWELLRKKVFHDNECPEWSIKSGMQIVKYCKGLPLSLVVIAGILAKEAWREEWWEEVAQRTGSYIVDDQNGCLEILALSYHHLPLHMRECFLYLGGFLEDHKFEVQQLIWLWMAEGFIKEDGSGSLEDIGESYLMDLIDRNLVIVSNIDTSNGAVRVFKLHDLVRELCLRQAKEEGFILQFSNVITSPYKPVCVFLNKDNNNRFPGGQNLRSFLFFDDFRAGDKAKYLDYYLSFTLLRVLDLQSWDYRYFPEGMELLIHLRYLAIKKNTGGFPSAICKLWSLQTLIYISFRKPIVLPCNISNLVNLRHLWNYFNYFNNPINLASVEKPMNLQSISDATLGEKVGNFQNCFPYLKRLSCYTYRDEQCDFESLTCLEKLKLFDKRIIKKNCITLPVTLRELELIDCELPWSYMSVIQSLSNLQVLKLSRNAFEGCYWNTDEKVFRQLKFLELYELDIERWETCSTSFPCLRQLEITMCSGLEEVPIEIGEIPTLELIKINRCSDSVNESVRRIQEEQNELGNYDLKIEIE